MYFIISYQYLICFIIKQIVQLDFDVLVRACFIHFFCHKLQKNRTVSGWLSGSRVRLSHGTTGSSWVCSSRVIRKIIIKMVQTASLHGTQCVRVGSLAVQPVSLKGRVVCGTVNGEMHLEDLLESIVREGFRILVEISIQCYMAFAAEKAL